MELYVNNFDEIFQAKAELAKFLKEKCSSEYYPQLFFKYSVKLFLIQKLLSKVSSIQTSISGGMELYVKIVSALISLPLIS